MRIRRSKEVVPHIQTPITHSQRHCTRPNTPIQPHAERITLINTRPLFAAPPTLERGYEIHIAVGFVVDALGDAGVDSGFTSAGLAAGVVVGDDCDVFWLLEGVE